jgi:hypothetical protein
MLEGNNALYLASGRVGNRLTIFQESLLGLGIDLGDRAVVTKPRLCLVQGLGHSNPDATSAVPGGKAKRRIWTPGTSHLVQDSIAGQQLQAGGSDTLPYPRRIHLPD